LIVDREKVRELFGVYPEQIPDLLGLWGDSSDNVPGAPGIGEKGARDLIQKFGGIETLLDRAAEVSSTKHRTSLMENRDQSLLSKRLVRVADDFPVSINVEDYKVQSPDRALLMPLLKQLEFTNMIKEYLPPEEAPTIEVITSGALPDIRDEVYFDVEGDRVALWTGNGAVHHVG